MAFDNSFVAVTAATYTAAQYNTYTRGNFTALWVYTTAGDIVYATSATALARLGKPSVDSLLKMGSSGVPSWVSQIALPYQYDNAGQVSSATEFTTTSTSFVDITAMTLDVNFTRACNVFVFVAGKMATNNASYAATLRAVRHYSNPMTDNAALPLTYFDQYSTNSLVWMTSGGVGSTNYQLQLKAGGGGATAYWGGGYMVVVGFAVS